MAGCVERIGGICDTQSSSKPNSVCPLYHFISRSFQQQETCPHKTKGLQIQGRSRVIPASVFTWDCMQPSGTVLDTTDADADVDAGLARPGASSLRSSY